jgi:hypothetical protein
LSNTVDNDDVDVMSGVSTNDDHHPSSQTLADQSRSPYLHSGHQATVSTSTFNNPNPAAPAQSGSLLSTPTHTAQGTPSRKLSSPRHVSNTLTVESAQSIGNPREQRIRRLHDDGLIAPTTMHWSRALVHGALPMRAHTGTLVDNVAWLFGGCYRKGYRKDAYCFDTGKSSSHHAQFNSSIGN